MEKVSKTYAPQNAKLFWKTAEQKDRTDTKLSLYSSTKDVHMKDTLTAASTMQIL